MKVSELGNRIKARRAEQGMTQAQLAEAVGVTRKTINTVENRIFVPSTILALKMAEALGASVDELFFLEEEAAGGD
ncbi:helix-turn-helix transcriptional regulator [Maricaulis sp.]|uniref:helix-turn-helix transcriptional regulator n=1 Tax=unclassified Maricaulis TaxID=2632371 RepID=UPI001B1ED7CB|nr:helix-turn-helix transcriptional regulator [Maricaulis sp.]MBO6797731.1 helix-turn-helix transcriptional regulator [Maricaulis sp.]